MQPHTATSPQISLIGPAQPGGVYLLWVSLSKPLHLSFGKFRQGERIHLPTGSYVYIGSAHAKRGAASLGYRLLRHATRSAGPSHHIRPVLHNRLQEKGLPAKLPAKKSLHWHIDYLLEQPGAELAGVAALLTEQKLEPALAESIASMAETKVIASGLGASDHARGTHLLHVDGGAAWWEGLLAKFGDDVNLFL